MKIKILGAGAMGSLFGGRLARVGADVELLVTNRAHREAINKHGLAMDLDDGQFTVPVGSIKAIKPAEVTGPADLVILFTKTTQSAAALESVSELLADPSSPGVMTLQNGLGNLELVANYVPAKRIIYGMSTTPADMVGPGQIASHGPSHTVMMTGDDERTPFLEEVCALINTAGLPCEIDGNVLVSIWEKVAFNCAMNAVLGVTRTTGGLLKATPPALELARNVAAEACDVARAHDVAANVSHVHAIMEMACEKHPNHKPSMAQDLLAHRLTEIDSINGAVVRAAQQVGMQAPLNDTLFRLIKLAEKSVE